MKKIKKLFKTPGVFFRDYFNKKHPKIYNELKKPQEIETIIIESEIAKEKKSQVTFPVDVVFTWVDDSDCQWREKKDSYQNNVNYQIGQYASDKARFSNHNELKYSIKSVLKNLPWVRNVFIITDNQNPSWIVETSDKIKIIDHREIIKGIHLPTFNSHVIEAHLHLIPNLSEHFIYFNDDVFVARELPIGHFFRNKNISSLFLSEKSLVGMSEKGIMTPTLQASIFSRELLKKHYNCDVDTPLVHTYVPLTKSMFEKTWLLYEDEIKSFLSSKFRGVRDLNLATFLVPWLTYLDGKATIEIDICYYFNVRSTASRRIYQELLKSQKNNTMPHSFCANDFNTEKKQMEDYQLILERTLTKLYP